MKYLILGILCCSQVFFLPTTCAWTIIIISSSSSQPRPSDSLRRMQTSRRTSIRCQNSVRDTARSLTGMSFTAIRATARAATGISLTAIYASTLAATSLWIRQTMKYILSVVPPPLRYFVQPFLVLYYAPLFWMRQVSRHNKRRKDQRGAHEALIEGWKQAVAQADETVSYWPIHLSPDGEFETDLSEMDVSDAISESIEVTYDDNKKEIQ